MAPQQSPAAAAPPPGALPPGVSDDVPWINHQGSILGICIVLMVLLWITAIARFWARFFVVKKPWWDDLFAALALLSFTGLTIDICVYTHFGLGKHVFTLTAAQITGVLKIQYIIGLTYGISTASIKIALLLQYLLVYRKGTWTYRAVQFMLVVCSLWGFAFVFISIFPCFPHPGAWWGDKKGCYGFGSPNFTIVANSIRGHSGSNFFLDVLVFLLAIRLQFVSDAQSRKKSMLALLLIGLISCSFALWRFIVIMQTGAARAGDLTFNQPEPAVLSVVEIYFATTCATLPFFWPVIVDGWNKIFVQFEFNVTETNVAEEEMELSNNGSLPSGRDSGGKLADSKMDKAGGSFSDFSFADQFGGFGSKKNRGTTTTVQRS